MNAISIRTQNSVKYIQKLLELEEGNNRGIEYDISHRGGSYTIDTYLALEIIGIDYSKQDRIAENLPSKIGAGCNYLGGGLRGSIFTTASTPTTFVENGIPKYIAIKLNSLCDALKARYIALESLCGLNDEEYEDGDTNWDAIGTNSARDAGIVSAY